MRMTAIGEQTHQKRKINAGRQELISKVPRKVERVDGD